VLLTLDYQARWNAIDASQHEYFRTDPLPAKPGDIPMFESSHELDRRKARGQKAGLPPAPKGGTVGMGPNGGWGEANGADGADKGGLGGYDNFNNKRYHNRFNPALPGGYRNGYAPPPPPEGERRPAWRRDDRAEPRGLPPRPPPIDYHDGGRSDRPDGYRSRSRESERPSLPRGRGSGSANIDTYIPTYGPDSGRPERRDDRRRRDDRDDRGERRHHSDRDRERERIDYDDRSRSGRTRSRSRSPVRDRDRRSRDPVDREREREREREMYRR
jgi:serine/threonine-protein kinase BUR1